MLLHLLLLTLSCLFSLFFNHLRWQGKRVHVVNSAQNFGSLTLTLLLLVVEHDALAQALGQNFFCLEAESFGNFTRRGDARFLNLFDRDTRGARFANPVSILEAFFEFYF